MQGERVSARLVRAIGAVVAFAASAISVASPFSSTYTGTIAGSTFAEIFNGQPYTVTLVFDNGGSTAASQTWAGSNLTCVIFQMNTAGNVTYSQDLVATSFAIFASGSLTTDSGGAVTAIFGDVDDDSFTLPAGTFSFAGFTPVPPVGWFLNSLDTVFADSSRQFTDATGSVHMLPANWSNPVPFSGTCVAGGGGGGTFTATTVPAMSEWMLALLAAVLLGLGSIAILRRRS